MPSNQECSNSESDGLVKLRKGIDLLRQDAVHGTHYFNPRSIGELCTSELVKAAVDDCPFPKFKKEWISSCIINRGILTFCILVHIEKEGSFLNFLEHYANRRLDSRLPLDTKALQSIAPEAARKFFDVQWQFIPVKLPKREYLQIDNEYILPYIIDKHHGDRAGSFGDIYEVTIESSMQDALEVPKSDKEGSMVVVIRKQIRFKGNVEGFAREKKCLEILQQLEHPNIVDLLCSYTYRGEHNLIFPCEDMDLNDFFKLPKRYREFESNYTFYLAMYGLISAVEYVHSCFDDEDDFSTIIGYHHDIRPRNILVRSNTFLLADFGLAKMSEVGQSSTSIKGGGGEYMAPECTIQDGHIGRAADIWSLGGVFLDIAAYMEHGPQGRIDAQNRREGNGPYLDATTTHFFSDGIVKPGVTETIEILQHDPKDKTLRTLLLVSEHMLEVQKESRPNAHTVRRDIAYVAIKSLFRAALQGMLEWRKRSGESDAGRIWEDTWKLWAWGEEIAINGANLATEKFKGAVPHADKNEKRLQNILHELVRLLGSKRLLEERANVRGGSNRMSTPEAYGEDAQKVNDRIRDLRTALPDDYGTRIKERKAYYGRFAKDPPGLPKLSDESLEPLSQNRRSLTLPLQTTSKLTRTSTDPGSVENPEDEQLKSDNGTNESMAEQQARKRNSSKGQAILPAYEASESLRSLKAKPSADNTDHEVGKDHTNDASLPPRPLVNYTDEKQKQTPKSTVTRTTCSTPGTNLFSQDSCSGVQTSATSPGDPASISDGPKNRNKALPPVPPKLRLPSPILDVKPSEAEPMLNGNGMSAKVTYEGSTREQDDTTFDIQVLGIEDSKNRQPTIFCDSKELGMSLEQDLRKSEFAYPHIDRPNATTELVRQVYFLGVQVMYEQHGHTSSSEDPDKGSQTAPNPVKVVTHNVCYTFTSPGDCKNFRQDVWGKRLLECLDASQIFWPAVKDAISVTVSLWKDWLPPARLTVSFRGLITKTRRREMIHLQLSKSNPSGQQNYAELHLDIEPPEQEQQQQLPPPSPESEPKPKLKPTKSWKKAVAKAAAAAQRRSAPLTLKIVFTSVDYCTTFKNAIVAASEP